MRRPQRRPDVHTPARPEPTQAHTPLPHTHSHRSARESAKNALEAYIYATREKLDGADAEAIAAVSPPGLLDTVRAGLSDAEEWLYEDGASAMTEQYTTRLAAARAPADPIFARVREIAERPRLLNETLAFLSTAKEMASGWALTAPHITSNETAAAFAAIAKFEVWFNTTWNATQAAPATEDPLLTIASVALQRRPVQDLILRTARKPKPTPTPTPKASTSAGDKKKADASSKPGAKKEEAAGDKKKPSTASTAKAGGKKGAASSTPSAKSKVPVDDAEDDEFNNAADAEEDGEAQFRQFDADLDADADADADFAAAAEDADAYTQEEL